MVCHLAEAHRQSRSFTRLISLMRYCNFCHRLTTGEPLFCNFCGHSYDVKLCPSRHINPRAATICSQCGSRDLSVPHPRTPLFKRVLLRFVRILPGALLLIITVMFFFGLITAFLQSPALQGRLVCLGVVIAVLWWMYLQLPGFIRHAVQRVIRRKRSGGGGHGHH